MLVTLEYLEKSLKQNLAAVLCLYSHAALRCSIIPYSSIIFCILLQYSLNKIDLVRFASSHARMLSLFMFVLFMQCK